MSVAPTEDALIVALDFEGELDGIAPFQLNKNIKFYAQQASTASSIQRRKTCFSCFSTPLFQIS